MTWSTLAWALVSIGIELLKEWAAKKNSNEGAIESARKQRVELYDAISKRDSGRLSRSFADRRDRLSVLLMGMHDTQSTNGKQDLLHGGSELPDGSKGTDDRSNPSG